jgi:hypothetical protein
MAEFFVLGGLLLLVLIIASIVVWKTNKLNNEIDSLEANNAVSMDKS